MHFFMLTADLEQHLSHKNMSNQCGLESDAIGPKLVKVKFWFILTQKVSNI